MKIVEKFKKILAVSFLLLEVANIKEENKILKKQLKLSQEHIKELIRDLKRVNSDYEISTLLRKDLENKLKEIEEDLIKISKKKNKRLFYNY